MVLKSRTVFLGIFILLSWTTLAEAQGVDPVQFIINPEVPGPNQSATIEIQGVGTFLGESEIVWQKDGSVALQGVGERVYTFNVGGLGVVTRVRATINSEQHGTIVRDFTFVPSAVNLVWEAKTLVPPLYRGKALYSAGSRLTVMAFPTIVANGSTISSNNLSFQWSRGGEPDTAASGLGRDTFSFSGDQLRVSERVDVIVELGGVAVGQASITIPATSPQIMFYARDPLRGVLYEQALPTALSLGSPEITLRAEPYFFSSESVGNSLLYTWKLNGRETTGPDVSSGVLTLRQSGAGAGEASVSAAIQNTDTNKFLQSAQAALRIVFGAQASNNAPQFGL